MLIAPFNHLCPDPGRHTEQVLVRQIRTRRATEVKGAPFILNQATGGAGFER